MESLSLGPRAEVTEMLLGIVCSLNLPKIPFSDAELRPMQAFLKEASSGSHFFTKPSFSSVEDKLHGTPPVLQGRAAVPLEFS